MTPSSSSPTPTSRLSPAADRRLRITGGLLLVCLAIVLGAQNVHQAATERQRAACQAQVNNAFAKITLLRGRLADQDRQANRTLLEAVARATDRTQIRNAEHAYLTTQHRLDIQRKQNPYPQLPAQRCG